MFKNFSIRFLRYEEVHERIIMLLSKDNLDGELERERSLILENYLNLYSSVNKLAPTVEKKEAYLFVVKQETLEFFKVSIDQYLETLKSTEYKFELNSKESTGRFIFSFSSMIDNLPLLELVTIPVFENEYNSLFNFGEWKG